MILIDPLGLAIGEELWKDERLLDGHVRQLLKLEEALPVVLGSRGSHREQVLYTDSEPREEEERQKKASESKSGEGGV